MSRLLSILPHARVVVVMLGVVGPVFLMGMRGERLDGQLAMAIFAGIAVGCSFAAAPLVFRFVAILSAVAAVVFQINDLFGPESTWTIGTAPVLWALQAVLFAALAYLVWWNQHRLVNP